MSVYYNEIDPYVAQWLRNLIGAGLIAPGYVDERSIRDVRAEDLSGFTQCHFFAGIGVWSHALRCAGWTDDRPVWTGSCPCQPFSAAGKQTGTADDRHLWPEWFRLIRECAPAIVFGEQVEAAIRFGWLDRVQSDMEGVGYAFGAACLPAAGVGAPHIRQRLWFVADAHGGDTRAEREQRGGQLRLQPESRGAVVMADAAEQGLRAWGRQPGASDGRGAPREQSGRLRDVVGVADAESIGLFGRPDDGDAGRRELTSGPGREANSVDTGRDEGRAEPGGRGAAERCGASGVGDAIGARLEGHGGHGDDGREPGRLDALAAGSTAATGANGRPGPVDGFWRAADWLYCRDGKWRPVEPGSEPLAHGTSFRLGSGSPFAGKSRAKMLRGYGNAICAPVAEAFVRAVMECEP